MKRWVDLAIVAALMTACIAMRLAAIPALATPRQDDAISYETATGHAGEYARIVEQRAAPFATWARAGDWQRLWAPADRFCFGRIATDLGRHDIHPPLYFWLLHLWVLVVGVSAHTGATLNLPIAALTLLLVYGLGLELSRSRAAAAIAGLLWAASPATLVISQLARQYELFALCSVASVWVMLRCSDPERPPGSARLALLGLTVAAGLLTHYHFSLVIAAATVAALWRLRGAPPRRRSALAAVIVAAAVAALAAHPHFVAAARRADANSEPFEWAGITTRANRSLGELAKFGGGDRAADALWMLALVAAAILATIHYRRRDRASGSTAAREPVAFVGAVAALVWCAIAALYVSFASPVHAMGPRYLSPVWPLLAVTVTTLLWRHHAGRALAVASCVAMLVAGSGDRSTSAPEIRPTPAVAADESLLLDSARRDQLARRLWHTSPATRVYASRQADLIAHPEDWLDALGERAVYASSIEYGNTRTRRDRLLTLLATRYQVTPESRSTRKEQWYRLEARAAPAPQGAPDQEPPERASSALEAGD